MKTRTVCWPDNPRHPDPWDDGCWPSLDIDDRFGALWNVVEAFRRNEAELSEVEAVATLFELTAPLYYDRNRPEWISEAPSLGELARITTDHWPAAGMDAPDIVLGAASIFPPPGRALIALAGSAFIWTRDWPQSSFHIWCHGNPMPSAALRSQIRGVGLAPWALWSVRYEGGELFLEDVTGLAEAYLPTGPVRVIGEQPTGKGLGARVFPTPSGWVAHCALDLPALPSQEQISRWIWIETMLARTIQYGITTEALLRKRPFLIRRALEFCVVETMR